MMRSHSSGVNKGREVIDWKSGLDTGDTSSSTAPDPTGRSGPHEVPSGTGLRAREGAGPGGGYPAGDASQPRATRARPSGSALPPVAGRPASGTRRRARSATLAAGMATIVPAAATTTSPSCSGPMTRPPGTRLGRSGPPDRLAGDGGRDADVAGTVARMAPSAWSNPGQSTRPP